MDRTDKSIVLDNMKNKFEVYFKNLGISIIHKMPNKKRIELLYLTLNEINFKQITFNSQLDTFFSIQLVQIDNQLRSTSVHPVILLPLELKKYNNRNPTNPKNFLEVKLSKKIIEDNTNHYNLLQINLSKIDIIFDNEILILISEFIRSILQIFNTSFYFIHPIFINYAEFTNEKILPSYLDLEEGFPSFFNLIFISAIETNISFFIKVDKEIFSAQTLFLGRVLGIALQNIESANIYLNPLEFKVTLGNSSEILKKIFNLYQRNLISIAISVFFSFNIIGNPSLLYRTLKIGVSDFFYRPIESCKSSRNPLKFVNEVYRGSKSLLQHFIDGIFGTFSRISSSVSGNILRLTFDNEYLKKREEQKQKLRPDTFIDGLGYGIVSTFKSFGYASLGIIIDPIQSVKKNGLVGLPKGLFFGLSGILIKPVCGSLDLVATFSEGIKNTVHIFSKKFLEIRLRETRVFYTNNFIIKKYSKKDSYIYNLFIDSLSKIDQKFNFIINEICTFKQKDSFLSVLITEKSIILFNPIEKNIIREITLKDIVKISKFEEGIILIVNNEESPFKIQIDDTEKIDEIVNLISLPNSSQDLDDFASSFSNSRY